MSESNFQVAQAPEICTRCGSTATVTVITKTISGIVKYYYKCSECGYQQQAIITLTSDD